MVKETDSFKAQSFFCAGTMKFETYVVLRLTAGSRMHCREHLCLPVIGTTPKRLSDFASRCMCVVVCVCVCFFFFCGVLMAVSISQGEPNIECNVLAWKQDRDQRQDRAGRGQAGQSINPQCSRVSLL